MPLLFCRQIFEGMTQPLVHPLNDVQRRSREKKNSALLIEVELLTNIGWDRGIGGITEVENLYRTGGIGVIGWRWRNGDPVSWVG